jgi:hypothetical protein
MKARSRLTRVVQVLNTAGFVAYLVWLATGHERILYARQGVLYLLPCIAFVFVFACLRHGPHVDENEEESPEHR